jgi:hypothetical protein
MVIGMDMNEDVQQPLENAFTDFCRKGTFVSGVVKGRNREEVSRFLLEVRHNIGRDFVDYKWRAWEVIGS